MLVGVPEDSSLDDELLYIQRPDIKVVCSFKFNLFFKSEET